MRTINKCITTDVIMADNFSDLSSFLENINKKILWVCDYSTSKMVHPLPKPNIVLDCGESTKNLKSIEKIISEATYQNINKDDIFLALGGGVVSDITAFAASIYKRGCKLILIPTTLLGMVDASIGGKTAIDFKNVKNLIGTFYPANKTIICTDCIKSLSDSSYMNGLGEIIKIAFLSKNQDLLKELVINKERILRRDDEFLKKIIELAINLKIEYVNSDPYEKEGKRKALNLGHTFGHALESLRHMNVSHGQAIAWGTCRAAVVAKNKKLCSDQYADSIIRLFSDYGFDVNYKINYGEWNEYRNYLKRDKKIINGHLKFIIPVEQGLIEEIELDEREIKNVVIEGPEVQDVLL